MMMVMAEMLMLVMNHVMRITVRTIKMTENTVNQIRITDLSRQPRNELTPCRESGQTN